MCSNTIFTPPPNFLRAGYKLGLFFLILLPARLFALDPPDWTGGFFLDLEGHYYIIPDFAGTLDVSLAERYGISGGLIKARPSFRVGAGYEWRKIRFSLESGVTWIEGNNPLILDIQLVPLIFKLGYVFSFFDRLTLVPLLGAGPVFSSVTHYETALAVLLNKLSHSSFTGFMANTGLRIGWSFMPALNLYAGAGVDWIIETGGPIPLPAVELGINFKPFLLGKGFRPRAARPVFAPEAPPDPAPEPVAVEIIPVEAPPIEPAGETVEMPPAEPAPEPEPSPDPAPEPEPLPEPSPDPVPEPEPPVRILRVLYFPADAAFPIPSLLAELDAAGELLRRSPALGVTLRGYTAPYSTPGAQRRLSELRARFCETYLRREYGIAGERIRVEWYGAERVPELSDGTDRQRRCVEIIIENRKGGES